MSFRDSFNRFFDITDEGETTEQSYYEDYEEEEQDVDKRSSFPSPRGGRKPAQTSGGLSQVRAEIRIIEPRVSSEVEGIADLVLDNKVVVVNFRKTENDDARKMIDYLNGVTYAVNGSIQRIGEEIFIVAPAGIEIDGEEIIPMSDSF